MVQLFIVVAAILSSCYPKLIDLISLQFIILTESECILPILKLIQLELLTVRFIPVLLTSNVFKALNIVLSMINEP